MWVNGHASTTLEQRIIKVPFQEILFEEENWRPSYDTEGTELQRMISKRRSCGRGRAAIIALPCTSGK